jgi:hypothetical protein
MLQSIERRTNPKKVRNQKQKRSAMLTTGREAIK